MSADSAADAPFPAPALRWSPLDPAPDRPWPELPAGTALAVVKRKPDGREVARYPGTVLASAAPTPWIAVEGVWGPTEVEVAGLRFVPGDRIVEYFSRVDAFNAFASFAPDGAFRGWYANAAYPAWLDPTTDPPTLTWHDLYVDVVALPDGTTTVCDEDELAESGLADRDPDLVALIEAARDEIVARLAARAFPFSEAGGGTPKPPNSPAYESESGAADVHPH